MSRTVPGPVRTRPSRPKPILALGVGLLLLGCPGSGLSGTWEAGDADGKMTLEFKADRKVRVTMQETGGQPDSRDGAYVIDGNKVTIQIPDGFPLTLVRDGGKLQTAMFGQMLTFEKK